MSTRPQRLRSGTDRFMAVQHLPSKEKPGNAGFYPQPILRYG
jgi:hypothetical protein